jgi:hypothetical protein
MAKQTTVTLIDDLDGGTAAESVLFALDGTSYEIDLSAKNAKALRSALAVYVAAARKTSGGVKRKAGRSASDADQIRAWAKENGHAVSERGRISAELRNLYASR